MIMRYYSDDYKARLKSEISRTKESVSDPDYTSAINNITVPFKGSGAKNECLTAAKMRRTRSFMSRRDLSHSMLISRDFTHLLMTRLTQS